MLIGYDASRAFVDKLTGTENYSLNLLLALAKIDRKNRYRVYLRESSQGKVNSAQLKKDLSLLTNHLSLPDNFELKIIRPDRLWTQVGLALETWRNPVDLLFVPAHTLPILRKRGPKTKYVVTIHDLGVEFLPGYHQFPGRYYLDLASKYAAGSADVIIAVSAATKADLIRRYKVNPKRVFVVHEGVDSNFFRPKSEKGIKNVKTKYQIEGDYILFVGTVQPRKNLEMLIRSFADLKDYSLVTKHLTLVVAGRLGWDWQPVVKLPKKLGIEKQVLFLGYVKGDDLPLLYSGAAVFAFPSLFEGFGLPILEALACGCRVVASDIAPHREIFEILRGPVTAFPPASAQPFRSSKPFQPSQPVGLRAVGNPASRVTPIAEAMTLVKLQDKAKWSSILYQSISKDNLSKSSITKIREFMADLSWEETAKQTLGVFEKVLR